MNLENMTDKWKKVSIDDITSVPRGRVDPQEEPELPYLSLKHIDQEKMSINGKAKAEEYKSSSVHFKPGDVLYGRLRPYLNKVYPADFEGIGSGEIIVLKPDELVTSEYLAYILNSQDFVRFADRLSTGDRPRVKYDQIKEYEVMLPPITEQEQIVEKIKELSSQIENGIEDLEIGSEKLNKYRDSVLHAAIEGRFTQEWRENQTAVETAEELLTRTKEAREEECGGKYGKLAEPSDIPEYIQIPDDWTWTSLSKIGIISRGKSTHRPRDDPILYGGDYPFIQTGDVRESNISIKTFDNTYNEKGLEQSKLWPKNTLCITIAANIAETAVLDMEACFPDSVVGFQTNPEYCNVFYIDLYFKTIQSDLEKYAPATAQKNINLGTLTDLPIALPPIEEQNYIVSEVHKQLSTVASLRNEFNDGVDRATSLRKAILDKALTGGLISHTGAKNASKNNNQNENKSRVSNEESKQMTLEDTLSGDMDA